jgi:hypothetical protein
MITRNSHFNQLFREKYVLSVFMTRRLNFSQILRSADLLLEAKRVKLVKACGCRILKWREAVWAINQRFLIYMSLIFT